MFLYLLSLYFLFVFFVLVLGIMVYLEDIWIVLIVGLIWFIGLVIVYYMKGFYKIDEIFNLKIS